MSRLLNADTALSVLVAVLLFSIITLGYMQWQAVQNRQIIVYFQQQQALQIAENQIARQMAGLGCERQVQQNSQRFQIEKCSTRQIEIRFSTGEIRLGKG